ncbi:hypothetical protein LIA77_08189 [Sarocladium implicatum]|nr:hypothetical protein LIA77_08189 [Sarocladium implicatum]
MHAIKGTYTNEAETWFNPSCGLTDVEGDEPGGVKDPNLPTQPGAPGIGDGSPGGEEPPQEGSGVVYIDPGVWNDGNLQCYDPAVIVIPPTVLPKPATINVGKYTTSFQVGNQVSTVTIDVPVVTTNTIPMFNEPLKAGETGGHVIQPYPSVTFPPVKVSVGGQTRTVTLPPWPHITMGPPESWTKDPQLGPGIIGGSPNPGQTTTSDAGGVLIPTMKTPSPVTNSDTVRPPPSSTIEWAWESGIGKVRPDPAPERETPLPEDDEDDDDDELGIFVYIPCNAWFFNLCIDLPDLKIKRWRLRFPVGEIGPGPPGPPGLDLGKWKIEGKLPPWPKITNPPGPGPKDAEFEDPPENCEVSTASVCSTLTSRSVEVIGGTTRTVDEIVSSTCLDLVGCYVEVYEKERETENPACTPTAKIPALRMAKATDKASTQTSTPSFKSQESSTTATRTATEDSTSTTESTSSAVAKSSVAAKVENEKGQDEQEDETRTMAAASEVVVTEKASIASVSVAEKPIETTVSSEGSPEKRGNIRARALQDTPEHWANDEATFINNCNAGTYEIYPNGFIQTPAVVARLERLSQYLQYTVVGSRAGDTAGQNAIIIVRNMPHELSNAFRFMSQVCIMRPQVRFFPQLTGVF